MGADYIPEKDAEAVGWMRTFAARIAEAPWVYQLSPPDASGISAAVDAFAEAMAVSSNPATRTKVTVARKDEARNAAKQLVRRYAGLIKANGGISDPDKLAVGVPPVNPGRRRTNAPATSPTVDVVAATPGRHTLRFADSMAPNTRAKPFGAAQLQVFAHVGDEPVQDPERASFRAAVTSTPFMIGYTAKDGGKYATYFARWVSRRGETGPWSVPKGMRVAA